MNQANTPAPRDRNRDQEEDEDRDANDAPPATRPANPSPSHDKRLPDLPDPVEVGEDG
ncbi:hypothetical protein [Burkholderia gladioli]|uniref:hypothetical protein n=1 Tax=Burkholderia gladioli TaxID=28095 RepID=UPI0016416F91|nr:hypothetical protein [Burkholderia gladioli]